MMVVWPFIVPSASNHRLSVRLEFPVTIVVTSTLPSHLLVKVCSISTPPLPNVFFDGVPSSMYTIDSELPATVRVIVILLPSTAMFHRSKLSAAFHVPAKLGVSWPVPTAIRCPAVRKYQVPSTIAGEASIGSFTLFTCSSSNVLPAFSTNVSPSLLVKKPLPSPPPGDGENPLIPTPPGRPCHNGAP